MGPCKVDNPYSWDLPVIIRSRTLLKIKVDSWDLPLSNYLILFVIFMQSCKLFYADSFYAGKFQLGRSKWNGNVGSTGIVLRAETPLCNVGRPAFSLQLNSGIEF